MSTTLYPTNQAFFQPITSTATNMSVSRHTRRRSVDIDLQKGLVDLAIKVAKAMPEVEHPSTVLLLEVTSNFYASEAKVVDALGLLRYLEFEPDFDEPITLEELAEQQRVWAAANQQEWVAIELPPLF